MLFIDEPETNLHPKAIVLLVEMLYLVAQSGVQIYIATHSEFLLKRLEQLVRDNKQENFVNMLSITQNDKRELIYQQADLINGIIDNPILEQSIDLYHKDVELDLS